jgi:hypothetical protein
MATNSNKTIDPVEAALSAVEEALKLDLEGAPAEKAGEAPAVKVDPKPETLADKATRSVEAALAEPAAKPAPAPKAEARKAALATPEPANDPAGTPRAAANDDRLAVSGITYALTRRPSSAPYWYAAIAALVWVGVTGWLAWTTFAPQGTLADLARQPNALIAAAGVILPVFLLFGFAVLLRRAQELRLTARSMTEIALRLAEPETNAQEAVVSVGHAIRREMAAVGDGLERVVARAGEIEVLVHNEVSSLERAYGENELRIRSLIEELVNQREAIVNNSERVRAAISGAHEGLSGDLMATRERIVEAADEATKRLVGSLGDKSVEINNTLSTTVEGVVTALDTRSASVIERLSETGRTVAETLSTAGQVAAETLSVKGFEITDTLNRTGDQIVSTLTDRSELLTETVRSMGDRKSTRLNSSHNSESRMPSSA